ncbi:S8 family serine peptidase [candidate division KSB1 bacterium]
MIKNSADLNLIKREPGKEYNYLITPDDKIEITSRDIHKTESVIVEFKDEPLFIELHKNGQLARKASDYQTRFDQFEVDLREILSEKSPNHLAKPVSEYVHRKYYRVFFGVSIEAPSTILSDLRELDYVRKIHFNREVKADLDISVPIVKGDQVWEKYNTTGEGIIVGIIDTGIDYLHPDLGGGFGPGFKVAGGYDFYNEDDDPIDDNNHGTHVAGIVAGDGETITGVAPGATLYAYKALGSGGSGDDSIILAAIERTADPNQDDDYSDHLDVVNLSLGSASNADSPLCTALNNASLLGVTFCASAGNSGTNFSVGAPGAAEMAITVGASDDLDLIASFSSRGPNRWDYAIKPEVIAPGVSIYSSILNGEYDNFRGTSMSCPHVAGVAALIKSVHQNWEPQEIKAALMNTAVDIGEEVMTQGAGRIDALKAIEAEFLALPGHLSFGLDDIKLSVWSKSKALTLKNMSGVTKYLTVSKSGLATGISLDASETSITLLPGNSREITFTLSLDNSLVSDPETASLSHSGTVNIKDQNSEINIPWSFTKGSELILNSDFEYPYYILHDRRLGGIKMYDAGSIIFDDPFTARALIQEGAYDLYTRNFDGEEYYIFLQENIDVEGITTIETYKDDAVNTITLNGKDESGQSIFTKGAIDRDIFTIFPGTPAYRLGYGISFDDTMTVPTVIKTTNLPDYYPIYIRDYQQCSNTGRLIIYDKIGGLQNDVELMNSPADLIGFPVKVVFPAGLESREVVFPNYRVYYKPEGGKTLFGGFSYTFEAENDVWEGTLHLMRNKDETVKTFATIKGRKYEDTGFSTLFETQQLQIENNSLYIYPCDIDLSPVDPVFEPGKEIVVGGGGIYSNAFHYNSNDETTCISLSLYSDGRVPSSSLKTEFGLGFFGQNGEFRESDIYLSEYRLYNDDTGELIDSGFLDEFSLVEVSSSKYRLEITNDEYVISGVKGKSLLKTISNLRSFEPNPPRLTSLRISDSNGKITDNIQPGESVSIRFSAGDFRNQENSSTFECHVVDTVRCFYKSSDENEWTELAVTNDNEHSVIGTIYYTEISDTENIIDKGIDLKIELADIYQNKTEWVLGPAFAIGDISTNVEFNNDNENILPDRFHLGLNYPNPFNPETNINFNLPAPADVILQIYNIKGQLVKTLVSGMVPAGTHIVKWDGTNSTGVNVASGVYIYRIKAGNYFKARKMILIR